MSSEIGQCLCLKGYFNDPANLAVYCQVTHPPVLYDRVFFSREGRGGYTTGAREIFYFSELQQSAAFLNAQRFMILKQKCSKLIIKNLNAQCFVN